MEKTKLGNGVIKVFIKEPNLPPRTARIKNTLENFQIHVGGNIETLSVPNGVTLVFNEDGKIKDLPFNINVMRHHYINPTDYVEAPIPIYGTVIACSTGDGEFKRIKATLDDSDALLKLWGNKTGVEYFM